MFNIKDIRSKVSNADDIMKGLKQRIDTHDVQLKKAGEQAQMVDGFSKRVGVMETKLDVMRENADKRHETIKDFVNRTKDSLDSKVEMAIAYNEKIVHMRDELNAMKEHNNDFKDRVAKEINDVRARVAESARQVMDLAEKQQAYKENTVSEFQEKNEAIQLALDKFE